MAETPKKKRFEIIALGILLALLAWLLYANRAREAELAGIQTGDASFHALGVSDPALRLDLLERMQKEQYQGVHRNIFTDAPLAPPVSRQPKPVPVAQPPMPLLPPAPPPLVVPATLFGIVTNVATGQRRAVFSTQDNDVFIVPEGGTLLGQFRVDKIGVNSVDVEEVSSGRKTTITLTAPVDSSQPSQAQS